MKVYLIEGPLMNRIEQRDAQHYGTSGQSHIQMIKKMHAFAQKKGISFDSFQSDIEGEIVSFIANITDADGLIINAAAYTHTSVAIRDVLEMKQIPTIECHLSRVFDREEFRQKSLISPVASGVIAGVGSFGYELALRALVHLSAE